MPVRIGGFDCTDIRTGKGGTGATRRFPFQILISRPEGGISYKLYPGTINQLLPSNMFDIHYNLTPNGTWYVILYCTSDGDSVTGAFIDTSGQPPDAIGSQVGVAPAEFQILLGIIVAASPFNVIQDSFSINPEETIQTLRSSPSPGTPYYEINYTWILI